MKAVYPFDRSWSVVEAAQMACLLEASAPKLGNVHPTAGFSDMRYEHFLGSALAIGRAFSNSADPSLGTIVLAAVQATQSAVGCNTNLGTLLLFAPLAKAAALTGSLPLRTRISRVLDELSAEDCQQVYEAIRLAHPGGLGDRESDDVRGAAPTHLVAAMAQVADVDAVARQYTNGFADILDRLLPWFEEVNDRIESSDNGILDAICRLQLRWLAHEPDGLIVRKLGNAAGEEVQRRAKELLPQVNAHPGKMHTLPVVRQFDQFLRADGHRRNPGTTADLIAAAMFAGLLKGFGG